MTQGHPTEWVNDGTKKTSQPGRVQGLDVLRVIAILLVIWQHAASVLGAYSQTNWYGIGPGQSGVAIFCAVAGFLAFRHVEAQPLQWLRRRLLKIYPAYWIVTLGAFALALKFSSDRVTLGLFVSQLLGTGYFTHGWALVNVASWFVSLILLCYVLATIALISRRQVWLMLVFALLALLSVALAIEVDLSRHVLTFCLGALAVLIGRPLAFLLLSILLVVIGFVFNAQLCYAGIGALALGFCGLMRISEPPLIRLAALYSYEYFLVHGIFLAGMVQVFGAHGWVIALALMFACIAAVILKQVQQPLTKWLGLHLLDSDFKTADNRS